MPIQADYRPVFPSHNEEGRCFNERAYSSARSGRLYWYRISPAPPTFRPDRQSQMKAWLLARVEQSIRAFRSYNSQRKISFLPTMMIAKRVKTRTEMMMGNEVDSLGKRSQSPYNPKNMKVRAAIHFTALSGILFPSTIPIPIPIASAISMPVVVPIRTGIMDWYLAARLTVASWVLSPISAKKKAIATVQNGLKWNFWSSSFNSSPRIVHSPKRIKEAAAAIWT